MDSERRCRRFASAVVLARKGCDFAASFSSTLLHSIMHGRHYIQRVERYQISRLIGVTSILSEQVGAGRASKAQRFCSGTQG